MSLPKTEEDQDPTVATEEASEVGNAAEWLPKVLKNRPEILEIYERSRPLTQRTTFARQFGTTTTEARHVISHKNVTQMIMTFLKESGYERTLEKLEQETNLKRVHNVQSGKSTLVKLLEMSIKDVSSVLDPQLSSLDGPGDGDNEVEVFDYVPSTYERDTETDVNIWDEGPTSNSNLVITKQKTVVSATFNKIIEYITSPEGDIATRKLILATYRSWTTPDKLFAKLLQRYSVPPSVAQHSELGAEKFTNMTRRNVVTIIKAWISEHPEDFSEQLVNNIRNFVENTVAKEDTHLAKFVRGPLAALQGTNKVEEATPPQIDVTNCPEPKVPKTIFSLSLTLDEVPKEEIARQMTLIDFQLFTHIRPVEFLSQNWIKSSNVRTSAVAAIINRFNQIVKWVITSILRKKKHKERAKVIINFLEIANYLMGMQSYNTMAAIFAGLTHASVYRLSHTFNELTSEARKIMNQLETFLHPARGYYRYKDIYKNVVMPPCIPFLGAHLQDISIIEATVPDRCGEMISIAKRRMLHEQIQQILRFQSFAPTFLPVQQISAFLHKFDTIKNENDMFNISLLLEPKGITSKSLVDHEESLQQNAVV